MEIQASTTGDEWRRNRQTHRWVTLNGEDYSCDFCDTRTGSQPCPGGMEEWLDQAGWDGFRVPTPEELDEEGT